jgi:ACR3 family arsenite transporter
VVNWLIKPFTMAALGVLFFEHVFAPWVDPQSASEYIAGMILLGVAPCTAMVFVWSQLVKDDPNYTLVQVAVNDLVMVVAFAPVAAFLLGVTNVTVPWQTLVLSTVLYGVLPLLAGVATRRALLRRSPASLGRFVSSLKPWSVLGLIATVVLLFGFQAGAIVERPGGLLVAINGTAFLRQGAVLRLQASPLAIGIAISAAATATGTAGVIVLVKVRPWRGQVIRCPK